MIAPPRGHVARTYGEVELIVAEGWPIEPLLQLLAVPEPPIPLRGGTLGTGRGPGGRVELGAAGPVWIKAYRRGGWLARFNRERYFAMARFSAELIASRAARDRGIPSGETVALAFHPAHPGWRVFGASRWVEGSTDLAQLWQRPLSELDRSQWLEAALRFSEQLADQGFDCPDLNLGNLIVIGQPTERSPLALIDFDRICWRDAALGEAPRQRMKARLRRSAAKLLMQNAAVSDQAPRR